MLDYIADADDTGEPGYVIVTSMVAQI